MRCSGESCQIEGALTFDTVGSLIAAAQDAGITRVDFAGVSRVDSAALALLIHLRRLSPALAFDNLPPSLAALAVLYGVDPFLGA